MPNEHYFSRTPQSQGRARQLKINLRGHDFQFLTKAGVFSRTHVDRGTRLLIKHMQIRPTDRVLDLGCGWGAVGVVAARLAPEGRVLLVDINARAVELARRNLELNGLTHAKVRQGDGIESVQDEQFEVIALNPPIRAGTAVVHRLIEGAKEHLAPGGAFYLVARTQQGVLRLAAKMSVVFGGVEEVAKGGGFRLFVSRLPE